MNVTLILITQHWKNSNGENSPWKMIKAKHIRQKRDSSSDYSFLKTIRVLYKGKWYEVSQKLVFFNKQLALVFRYTET